MLLKGRKRDGQREIGTEEEREGNRIEELSILYTPMYEYWTASSSEGHTCARLTPDAGGLIRHRIIMHEMLRQPMIKFKLSENEFMDQSKVR